MNTTRRGFLKISGVAIAAAAVPFAVMPVSPGMAQISPQVAEAAGLSLRNLQIGSAIRVVETATGDEIFRGIAESETVNIDYSPTEQTDITIQMRKRDFQSVQITANANEDTAIAVYQPRDEIL